jgi:hypothetical protein
LTAAEPRNSVADVNGGVRSTRLLRSSFRGSGPSYSLRTPTRAVSMSEGVTVHPPRTPPLCGGGRQQRQQVCAYYTGSCRRIYTFSTHDIKVFISTHLERVIK